MQKRCDRNRKRSKRRAIYCPIHGCYLDSVSQKYQLFADTAGQLQQRGMARRSALMLVANHRAVPLEGEWLEAFWCDQCQNTKWYHVLQYVSDATPHGSRSYKVRTAQPELWQQAEGVINPQGNPSVGEFTRRHARMASYNGSKDFNSFVD